MILESVVQRVLFGLREPSVVFLDDQFVEMVTFRSPNLLFVHIVTQGAHQKRIGGIQVAA